MIEYDKYRISDPAYIKELLEKKYIKFNNKEKTSISFIIKINKIKINKTIISDEDNKQICCIDMECSNVFVDPILNRNIIEEYHNSFFKLDTKFFERHSFITKEEFINNVNIIIKNIQEGIEQ